MEYGGVYYKRCIPEGDGMSPKDVHLADCVSKPELPWGEVFLFGIIVLNPAGISFGGPGVLCSSTEHVQTVKASCCRNMISVAAGLCQLRGSCRSHVPRGGSRGGGSGEQGEAEAQRAGWGIGA